MEKLIEVAKRKVNVAIGGRNWVVKWEVQNRQLIATLRSGVRLWVFIK